MLSDHKSRNPKLLRYSLELQGRDYNISHVPGAQHSHVDAISRFPYRWLSRLEGTLKKFNARAVEDMEETALKLRAPDDANLLQLSKWNDNDGEIKKMLENSYKSGDMEHTPKISFRAMTRSKAKSMNLVNTEESLNIQEQTKVSKEKPSVTPSGTRNEHQAAPEIESNLLGEENRPNHISTPKSSELAKLQQGDEVCRKNH